MIEIPLQIASLPGWERTGPFTWTTTDNRCISEGCDNPRWDDRQCGECINLTRESEREI